MEKHRLSYKIGSVRFDIDRYTGEYRFIPEFLEIEGPEEDIKKYAKLLGFQERDCLPWSTDELISRYQGNKD
jgi:adenylate cyclase class IV